MHGQSDDEQFDIPLASKLNVKPDVLTDGPICIKARFPEGEYFFDYSPASTLSGERDVRKDLLMSRLESRRITAAIKQGLINAGLGDHEASAVIQSVRETLAGITDKELCDLVLNADKDALSKTTSTFDAARLGILFAIQDTPYSVDGKSYRMETPAGQTIYVIQIISERFELSAYSQKGKCVWKGLFYTNASPDSDMVMSRLSQILGSMK